MGGATGGYNGAVNDLENALRRVVRGDVRFDAASRLLYSTDASMYQVEPLGVVMPRDADDVRAAVEVARQQQVALLPRGGGTSLTGQTVNRALVLDFTRSLHNVLEVNTEERWARVQPGVVQDEVNHPVRSRPSARRTPRRCAPAIPSSGAAWPATTSTGWSASACARIRMPAAVGRCRRAAEPPLTNRIASGSSAWRASWSAPRARC